ncbi:amidase family protein [Sodalis sp. RH21]|uniref:amidase family protein n=1 Tax=unclassified Sodalis (in: enterobacteria) TaxID=2636512 RepID=UPI0039B59D96
MLPFGQSHNRNAEYPQTCGSSSGSDVAVAAGYADLTLGTNCGGSVGLPDSH